MTPKETISHINCAIPPMTHTAMYLMHKYWARKPHNVVGEYIEHYSKKGDLVLDPFSGSGVTAIEALRRQRKAIATDLDPMSTFITRMTIDPVELKDFQKSFEDMKKKLRKRIDSLYETVCPKCGTHVPAEAYVWNDGELLEIRLSCRCSSKTLWKKPTRFDLQKFKEAEAAKIPYWYPDKELIWNTRINVNKGEKVSDLFTRRNLQALSIILHGIETIKNTNTKELMKFTFSSTLGQASKLVFVIRQRGRAKGKVEKSKPEVGSWATRGYWVPPEFFEINAWNCFEQRYRKICRGKEETNKEIPRVERAKDFSELANGKNFLVETLDVLELSKVVPDDCIDYVFTDPPYGDSVPYLELDNMWSAWLGFEPDFGSEIIISNSPQRKEKNFEMYHKMLCAAFREIYRVLKKGKYLTVTFHNTDIQVYNSIISSVILAGFDLEKIIYQPPARTSPKGLLAPYGSAVGDYYIRFRKPEKERGPLSDAEIDKERYERIVTEAIRHIIAIRGEPTPYSVIINNYSAIYDKLKDNGFLFSAPQTVEQILKRQLDKEFVIKDSKWWFKDPSVVPYIEQVPLNERVEKVTLSVLNKKIKVTFDDVLSEIFTIFTNAQTPDIQTVKEVLSELATQTKDGKWMLKTSIKQRESEHDNIVEILAKLGEKAGYKVYADLPDRRVKLDFPSIPKANLQRIQEIDVLWYEPTSIAYEFEVENTTGIIDAIVRGANIPTLKTKRFIVIPEERQGKFYKIIAEPAITERIHQSNWGFIFYDKLTSFFEQHKKQKEIDLDEFNKVCHVPNLKTEKQPTMDEFQQK